MQELATSSFRWLLDQWGLERKLATNAVHEGFRWLLDQWGLELV